MPPSGSGIERPRRAARPNRLSRHRGARGSRCRRRGRRRPEPHGTTRLEATAHGVADARRRRPACETMKPKRASVPDSASSARSVTVWAPATGDPGGRRPCSPSARVSRFGLASTARTRRRARCGPCARRAERMARPARVRMRRRKPCFLARRRLFGWKVRLLMGSLPDQVSPGRSDRRRCVQGNCPKGISQPIKATASSRLRTQTGAARTGHYPTRSRVLGTLATTRADRIYSGVCSR